MLIAVTVLEAGIAHGQTRDTGLKELLNFQSATYTGFRQVLEREAPTTIVTVSATLRFPNEAKERYPAVVVVHTLAGYQESNEGWHAAELRKAGFATLTYDSFARCSGRDNSGLPLTSRTIPPAFLALLLNKGRIRAPRF